jgi:Na+-transporting methylmalonyl-CoA/oxaloacetate decarboxylase gamma subunit
MVGRVLVLLVAALLTMGAVVPEGAPPYIAPDRTDARTALDRLTAEALRPTASTTEVRAVAAASAPALAAVSPEPARVARWWSSLTPAARGVLVTAAPGIVGNLEGVPYAVRDAANRAVLRDRIAAVERRLASGAGRGEGVLLATRLRTFEQVAAALHRTPGGPPRSLITLDAESGDRAAVAIGDLDTADYVDFLVPGMYFSVEDQMVDWTDTAAAIQSQERASGTPGPRRSCRGSATARRTCSASPRSASPRAARRGWPTP